LSELTRYTGLVFTTTEYVHKKLVPLATSPPRRIEAPLAPAEAKVFEDGPVLLVPITGGTIEVLPSATGSILVITDHTPSEPT
jgi:hypothetical protein